MPNELLIKCLKPDGTEEWMSWDEVTKYLDGTIPIPDPFPLPDPVPDPDDPGPEPPLDPFTWETHPTTETWPKELNGYKVAYLEVHPREGQDEEWLRRVAAVNEKNMRFTISTVKGLREGQDSRPSQRVGAKEGRKVMVLKDPRQADESIELIYNKNPVSGDGVFPVPGDGGAHCFIVAPWQTIDGLYIGDHPHVKNFPDVEESLYLPMAIAGTYIIEYFDPWS